MTLYLQDIVSWRDISDVNPLTVNVGRIDVIASWAEPLRTQPHPQPGSRSILYVKGRKKERGARAKSDKRQTEYCIGG